ncbi:hypothetical protein SAMN06265379_10191 [Saccharicrinis carchari]|uniref:Uncharacterized protein n=2 Tax=Saccharicrinis carchari TaxID=1168039 RepID=A0A521AEQ7_SACCC|nr:hypothetical protein SAMN06265379_10191 [Saccharicrinis carchari]
MKIITLVMMIVLPIIGNAQIEATTEDGKAVLLYKNGTWEYVKEKHVQMAEVVDVEIEEGLTSESPLEELYYAESKRLVKYFGPIKGKIKGRAKCMIVDGQPKLFFQWEVGLLDSYRYFGHMKAGRKVTLKSKNGTLIELALTEDIDMEFVKKYNFSVLKGASQLSDVQFSLLMNSAISEIEVDWKKEPEAYPVNDPYYFSKTFMEILN